MGGGRVLKWVALVCGNLAYHLGTIKRRKEKRISFAGPLWAYCIVSPLQYFGCFIVVVALMLLGGQTLKVM